MVVFDIDGVVRDVGGSYRRALADTVEHFTAGAFRPTPEAIDALKSEGIWNNDWEASQELIARYFKERDQLEEQDQPRDSIAITYDEIVAFFQARYRGTDPDKLTGYICDEPLLLDRDYFASLTAAGIGWGFFSGATRPSATYVTTDRIGLVDPVLVAMDDAPGKPDPTGLFDAIAQIEPRFGFTEADGIPVIYVGDTVADMQTITKAIDQRPGDRRWYAVGVLPPHVTGDRCEPYREGLRRAGADLVFDRAHQLNPEAIGALVSETA
ncbi:MAG: TIGR01548 family HAD-type hydrolase [Coleofasciculaceae cyanobacterium RL_1_1]|nr:TIGR01548 family HAD-type hydrolase [Coleofasciculaceae cyanobacterium RL_1_1]